MAVGTDDAVTGGHDAFFGQEGVLNTHLTHVVEVEDIILVGKLAALLGLGGALDVLIGDEVIQHDGDVRLVEHAVKARLLELVDGDRGGDIVAQHDIEPGIDELACLDLRQTRMCGQNFLRQSHSHNTLSFCLLQLPQSLTRQPPLGGGLFAFPLRNRLPLRGSCHGCAVTEGVTYY